MISIRTIILDNSANCMDFTDPENITLVVATDYSTDKVYTNYPKEFLMDFEHEDIISNESIATVDDELEIEQVLSLFNLTEMEPFKVVYSRTQHYGGAEEGGWYYHKQLPTGLDADHPNVIKELERGLDQYDSGYVLFIEPVVGLHTIDVVPHYC
jgi:hypothetical protein